MLNRSFTMQILLTVVAVLLWLIYLGGRFLLTRKGTLPAQRFSTLFYGLLTSYAVAQSCFVFYAWTNRAPFPLNLETMELLKLQHVKRLLDGLPLYVAPSSGFIPLVYNPLYYYVAIPFTWILGPDLLALRSASIVASIGAYTLVYLAVRRTTHSVWWGIMALGLIAAAFRVMDTYLDNAAPDSWTLFTILLGCYLISLGRGRWINLLGIVALCAAFWFKQYADIFTVGAVLYLTWQEGWRRALPYWLTAFVLGPLLYLLMPVQWLGPAFHYYTWEVPQQWSEFSVNSTLVRVVKFIIKHYAWLALFGGGALLWQLWHDRRGLTIWHFMLPFALISGPYVALDPGNNNNVFIPLGAWLIISGVIGIAELTAVIPPLAKWGAPLLALLASFALLLYQPLTVLKSRTVPAVYSDLVATLATLDGPVYAPGLGELQDVKLLYPTVHWVPLIDLIRTPGADLCDQPLARELLAPVLHPTGPAYILMEHPLAEDAMLSFLSTSYVLDTDFANRFIALRDSPKLLETGWPMYLYRYAPAANTLTDSSCG